jgi:hypothetical protein
LAASAAEAIVTGDAHLTVLAARIPVVRVAELQARFG